MVLVSASVLAENCSQDAVDSVKSADMLHLDILDGKFVPGKTIWADTVALIKTDLPKRVHLMTMNPEEHVQDFIDAEVDGISFHIEATEVPEAVIGLIKQGGVKAGIAIGVDTPVEKIFPYLEEVDFVLVMPIRPGASGRGFEKSSLDKIRVIKNKFPDVEIVVDGGINNETGKLVVDAGADIIISDSYIHNGNPEERIRILKNIN